MTDLRRMRAVFLGAMLVFSLSAMAVTAADDVTVPATEKKVTLQLDGTPIIDAIDMLFKDSGYKYTIEPGVSGSISFGFKNVGFEQAVKTVAESAGLEYEVSGGRYVFRPARPLQVEVMEPDPSVNPTLETEDDNIVYQEEEIVGITTPWEEGPIYYGHMYPSGYQFPPFFE
ncbi:MAG TPA: hypothetical protein PLP86_08595, partial [Armatimonadota bacterium]|nr:hypothetical protein [Armatimonadota bacterium]